MDNLVKQAQKRNADAFTELMQSQMQNMYKTAWAILHNDEDAADAISDTILVCWEKLGQLKQAEFFKTWMTRILINQCNNILRQRKKVVPMDEILESTSQSREYENVEWMETLKGLDEKYRLIIILYYVNGLKTNEISDILHMPVSTVRTRLSRGRKQMASLYNVNPGKEHSL
ncbi:MAG: sigma-70 family RNA polymerase sigma factor [Lachnospiraceae bacterium]|nr:sigma-70 family RNA polymerase sigma factor [Lachnospiraceae bacterium]